MISITPAFPEGMPMAKAGVKKEYLRNNIGL